MAKRRRFKQAFSLKDRLKRFAENVREKAGAWPPGPAREDMLRKARQANTAAQIEEWVTSPGLQPPK